MPVTKKNDTFYTRDWCSQIDIDYFTAFVKVYIPFNSWMNEHIQGDTDRAKINRLKDSDNDIRRNIISFLKSGGQDSNSFRSAIGSLHIALENATLVNNGQKISFEDVYFGPNKQYDAEEVRYGVVFHAHYDRTSNAEKTILTIRNRKGDVTNTYIFQGYPTKDEVCTDDKFIAIKTEWQDILLALHKQVNPLSMGSLLTNDEQKCIKCGTIKLIEDTTMLAVGIVEILYNLRNALFHGIINPTQNANRVYGAAYQVLYPLIKSLV